MRLLDHGAKYSGCVVPSARYVRCTYRQREVSAREGWLLRSLSFEEMGKGSMRQSRFKKSAKALLEKGIRGMSRRVSAQLSRTQCTQVTKVLGGGECAFWSITPWTRRVGISASTVRWWTLYPPRRERKEREKGQRGRGERGKGREKRERAERGNHVQTVIWL